MQANQRSRRIPDRKNPSARKPGRFLHTHPRAGRLSFFRKPCHFRIAHKTTCGPAKTLQGAFMDAGKGHLRICHNSSPGFECFHSFCYRAVRKNKVVYIVKIRRRMNHPFDNRLVFR